MGLLDALFGSQMQSGIDQAIRQNYNGFNGPPPTADFDFSQMLPPEGSSPGFAGGWFGGRDPDGRMRGATEEWRQPNPLGDAMDGEDIVVEAFKPKKRSFWGKLGDAFLMSQGHKPVFENRVYRKNMERAMRGVMDNPEEVIRRISTFDPEAAWKMRGQLVDDQRADMTQQRLMGKDRESIIQRSAGILGQINEDGSNYDAVRTLYNNTMRRNNIDFELPEEFDKDLVGGLYTGAISPDKQEMHDYRQEMLRIRQQRLEQQGRDTDSKIADRTADNARQDEALDFRKSQAKNKKSSDNKLKNGQPATEGAKEYSPDKTKARLFKNGRWLYFKRKPGANPSDPTSWEPI